MNCLLRVVVIGLVFSPSVFLKMVHADEPSKENTQQKPVEKSDRYVPLGVFMQEPSDEDMKSTSNSNGASADKLPKKKEVPDYRVQLESGETMDVGDIFRPEIQEFQTLLRDRLRKSKPPMIRLFHDEGKKPMLFAEHRGKVLDGLFASFAEDGAPIAHISYAKGDRASNLLTWDEAHRPLVFAQYSDGELDGIRCLFRGCCDECTDGHVWLVQQWKKGVLKAAHLIGDPQGKAKTFVYRGQPGDAPYGGSTKELDIAMLELEKFKKRLGGDEKRLKLYVAQFYASEKQASEQRMRLQNLRRSYQMASATQYARFPSVPTSGMAVG